MFRNQELEEGLARESEEHPVDYKNLESISLGTQVRCLYFDLGESSFSGPRRMKTRVG